MIAILDRRLWFPDPELAVASGPYEGLVAVGGDLSAGRLLLAYRTGVFPWSVAPITWWSPDPRAIFALEQFHVPRSLARVLRKSTVDSSNRAPAPSEPPRRAPADAPGSFLVTFNRAFRQVMEGCAARRRGKSWITPEFIEAYCRLHQAGHAHSVEAWSAGKLAGGVYGVAVGGLFAAESMFYRIDNASKVALYYLVERLRSRGYALFDIQMLTPVTRQLGARLVARDSYLDRLAKAVALRCEFGVCARARE